MGTTYLTDGDDLTSVADAIRAKSGGSSQLAFPAGFVSEIQAIPSGGGGDTQEDLLKVNGNTLTSFSNTTITSIRAYMFYGCSNLASINIPNVTNIGTSAFQQIGLAGNLTIEKFLSSLGTYVFKQTPITTATFKQGAYRLDTAVFERCSDLTAVDIGDTGENGVLSIAGTAFYYTSNITALIIRRSKAVFPLANAFPSSSALSSTATIYVPEALLSAYKSASNWSTYASRIVKIEGTTYETHWANGEAIS